MNWDTGWRDRVWSTLDTHWDVIVIGGGITGAGIFREAVRAGLKTLLVEARDFSYGTSSRSSKLVHGGLRYMKNAQFKTTLESVAEREYLLQQGKGLINRLGFLYASIQGDAMPSWLFGMGLVAYDLMARQWTHRAYDALDMRELCPILSAPRLKSGYRYFDAQTDDARLVLRVLREGVLAGGTAINYARVHHLLKDQQGNVCGVSLIDQVKPQTGRDLEIQSSVVVNATGAWANELRNADHPRRKIRPLRGSHLVFSGQRVTLTRAVSFMHPADGRAVFILPWENVAVLGTTDVDHPDLEHEPSISPAEFAYLLEGAQHVFPNLELTDTDVQATFSGVRPVLDSGKANPSQESRDHIIWLEKGLLTIAGGKLTTFRLMARDALQALRAYFPQLATFDRQHPILDHPPELITAEPAFSALSPAQRLRLAGRYAADLPMLLENARPEDFARIEDTEYLWAELRYAAGQEGIQHLDDLLLRRVRLGLLLPEGGRACLPQIRQVVQPVTGWNDARWVAESARYLQYWQECYNLAH
jgi:glycerol-3-phosphate dehydrogenase